MFAKFFYAYIILGIMFIVFGLYRIITDGDFTYMAIAHFVPAILFLYLAYKAYQIKKNHELM